MKKIIRVIIRTLHSFAHFFVRTAIFGQKIMTINARIGFCLMTLMSRIIISHPSSQKQSILNPVLFRKKRRIPMIE